MRVNDIISQNHFNIIIMKKVCIVTGGSSGIGLSIVKLFLDNNYQVFNLDITASSIGSFCYCDITDVTQVNDIISNIAKEHAIDVLVSNAGIHFSGAIENTSEADLERVFNINVKGAYAAIKAVLPAMKAQQNGAIILMSSDQALIAKHNSFAYNLSKAALASMAKTTALDYAQFNIRANAVCPGTIETPLYHQAINRYCEKSGANKAEVHAEEAALQPLGRLGKAEEVAELVHFLASDKAKFITGSLQVIDGGYTAQ
jgi:2-keto-3-deoxy-L-fuconate dehydrogenase